MMTFGSNYNVQKIRKNYRKNYRDPLALERRNKDINIDKARESKYHFYDMILESEYGREFN